MFFILLTQPEISVLGEKVHEWSYKILTARGQSNLKVLEHVMSRWNVRATVDSVWIISSEAVNAVNRSNTRKVTQSELITLHQSATGQDEIFSSLYYNGSRAELDLTMALHLSSKLSHADVKMTGSQLQIPTKWNKEI